MARGVVLPFFVREVRSITFTRWDPKNMQTRIASAGIQPRSRLIFVFWPKVDTYGTQQPIALLHYLISRDAMYQRGKEVDLLLYRDMRYVGAMGPPGGGRNPVDVRFIALFGVVNLTNPK